MSLQFRLNLVIILSMLLIAGMGTIFTIYSARQSISEEISSSVNLFLRSIEFRMSKSEFMDDSIADWQAHFTIPEKIRHLHVQLVPFEGQPEPLTIAPNRNISSSVPRWFVWWVKPQPLTKARVIKTRNDTFQILIHDNPRDEIVEAWGEARGLFGLILLQSLVIWILIHTVLGRALKSVPVILAGLEHIETGDYHRRLPDFSLPEFTKISAAFNHAASALEKARQENRDLTRRSLLVQEEERRVLSQELHDELGQSLAGIKAIATSIAKQQSASGDAVGSIHSICDHLFSVVRSMMRQLRPTLLDELGLAASLEDMIGIWREQNPNIVVTLHIDQCLESFNDAANIHLFRIVQESLSNIARHAKASEVNVDLQMRPPIDPQQTHNSMVLTIRDNGCGYDPGAVNPGFGLLGIRERAESLGGSFRLDTKPGEGTSSCVRVPCGDLLT